MPAQLLEFLDIYANLLMFVFFCYYILRLHAKEKKLEKKEAEIDKNYHHIVDNALAKERQILDDATTEANQIVAGAHYINKASRDSVDAMLQKMVVEVQRNAAETQKFIDQQLKQMSFDIQKEALATSRSSLTSYTTTLQHLSTTSLTNFQTITRSLETDLQKQLVDFHKTLLPTLEKELEIYKQARLQQTEQMATRIIQKVSQQVLNKSISLDDHHALLLKSLDKAKKEGLFD